MNKVTAILQKEWLELRQDRGLLLGTLMPPLVLTFLPIAIAYGIGRVPDEDFKELGAAIANLTLEGMDSRELGQAIVAQQFSILYLMMPLMIPSIIGAYSIVGEKTRHTLETVLATPIRTWELLLGKSLAALIPAITITWLCGAIFIAGIAAIAITPRVFAAVVSPAWLIVLLLCTPLLALVAIAVMVAVSSRVTDPRTAQQISAVVVVPIMAVFFGQLTGFLVLSTAFALGAAAVLAALAALGVWASTRLFQREVILTRWS
jgi:ABC-2 type transport system permease protein